MSDEHAESSGNAPTANAGSADGPPADFTTLVLSLHESALQLLGAKGDADVAPDRVAAKYQIDLLAMLQAKTSGNLTDDEERLLRTVLFELRTAYVDAAKA